MTNAVRIGNQLIGSEEFVVIAGPCSLESQEQFSNIAYGVKAAGACLLRGGMFKLRTNPDSFQGLGREAYDMAKAVKAETGMAFMSEVTDPRQIGDLMNVVDAFQVGSRNMHNYALLKELGQIDKPVLLKRGFSGLIKEWMLAADYLRKFGNDQVVLCERGIRTFETSTRNTFDLNAVAHVKEYSDYAVIADPSHATGDRKLVTPMALAAAAAGADGLLVEVHHQPDKAQSDGFQALDLEDFESLMLRLQKLLPSLGRLLAQPQ